MKQNKIIIEWDDCLMTEDVAASLSFHALQRASERDGQPVMWLRKEVEDLVDKAEDKLISLSDKASTFLLKGKDNLAVVGALIKKGANYIFKVITLHRKKGFVPNNTKDIVIDLSEDINSIEGGLADSSKIGDFNKEELKKGIRVEIEHTSDAVVALEIAMDHLKEDPEYYSKLEKIENPNNANVDMDNKIKELENRIQSLEALITSNEKEIEIEEIISEDLEYVNDEQFNKDANEYWKRYLTGDSSIQVKSLRNIGEDKETKEFELESDDTSLTINEEWEIQTLDTTDNKEVTLDINVECYYLVDSEQNTSLDWKEVKEVLVDGQEFNIDSELKTMLDKKYSLK